MKPASRNRHIIWPYNRIQPVKNAPDPVGLLRINPPAVAFPEKAFEAPVAKIANHVVAVIPCITLEL